MMLQVVVVGGGGGGSGDGRRGGGTSGARLCKRSCSFCALVRNTGRSGSRTCGRSGEAPSCAAPAVELIALIAEKEASAMERKQAARCCMSDGGCGWQRRRADANAAAACELFSKKLAHPPCGFWARIVGRHAVCTLQHHGDACMHGAQLSRATINTGKSKYI